MTIITREEFSLPKYLARFRNLGQIIENRRAALSYLEEVAKNFKDTTGKIELSLQIVQGLQDSCGAGKYIDGAIRGYGFVQLIDAKTKTISFSPKPKLYARIGEIEVPQPVIRVYFHNDSSGQWIKDLTQIDAYILGPKDGIAHRIAQYYKAGNLESFEMTKSVELITE